MTPLVSAITATWHRHDLLLGRCIPSVQAQSYPWLEHVVVSDGPDQQLANDMRIMPVRFFQLPSHDSEAKFGHWARLRGIAEARGDYLAYLDDDDSWRPAHVELLMDALRAADAGFAYSRTILHRPGGDVRIGDGPVSQGRITPGSGLIHKREILQAATWENRTGAPDWDLVRRWLAAGVRYASVDAVTVDYYPGTSDFSASVPVSFRRAPRG